MTSLDLTTQLTAIRMLIDACGTQLDTVIRALAPPPAAECAHPDDQRVKMMGGAFFCPVCRTLVPADSP